MKSSKPKESTLIFSIVSMAMTLIFIPPLQAQTSEDSSTDEVLEEIIVTARGVEQRLVEVPVSVIAFSQDEITRAGINDLEDLSQQTPGFKFVAGANGAAGRGNSDVRFRGLSIRATDPSNRPGAVFWDGGYMSHGMGILPLIDLQRAEVIKGPQMAYFGRNTFSGAVNFIPAEPGDEFSGNISSSYEFSNDDGWNLTAALGGPITDTLGVRVAAMTEKVGGDYEFRNGDPIGEERNFGATAVVTWAPTNSFRVKASGIFASAEDTHVLQGQNATVAPGSCNTTFNGELALISDRSQARPFTTDLSQSNQFLFCGTIPDFNENSANLTAFGDVSANSPLLTSFNAYDTIANLPPELRGIDIIPDMPGGFGSEYELWRTNLNGSYDLANGGELSAIISRGESSVRALNDNRHGSGTNGLPFLGTLIRAVRETHLEVRYTSSQDSRLRYMVGASYYDQDNTTAFVVSTWRIDDRDAENFGVFGSVDYDATDRLTLSLEGRWHDDELTQVFNGVSGTTSATSAATVENRSQDYSKFMPRVIADYAIRDNMHAYASWSQSRLQGVVTNGTLFAAETGIDLGLGEFTPPQENDTFEIGLKHRIGSLSYTVALYHTNWENQVFADGAFSDTGQFFSANIAGETEVTGIDLELLASPTDWLEFRGGFSYNDVEFNDFAGAGSITGILSAGANPPRNRVGDTAEIISVAGNRPRAVPDWTGNFSSTVWLDELLGINRRAWLRVDGLYSGDFFANEINFNKVDDAWRFNVRAGAQVSELFDLEVYVENATDNLRQPPNVGSTSLSGAAVPTRRTFGTLPSRREVGIRLRTNF